MHLITHDHRLAVKGIAKYYTRQSCPVYTYFVDASKAFVCIDHWTLVKKLIDYQVTVLIVRISFFGIKCSLYVLGGTLLFLTTFTYQMMFDRVVNCVPNYLHYI